MFTVDRVSTRIRRISIGFAVAALALTCATSPITVAAQEDIFEKVQVSQVEDVNFSPPPQADLQVMARGKRIDGGVTKYFFVIKNNGPANATPVNAYKEAQAKAMIG